jgi:zinc transport system substrate-binding protein
MNKISWCVLLAFALFFFCDRKQPAPPKAQLPSVFVSIVPQKYFVDRISGGLVECLVMVPPGANVHSYEPRPLQMSILSKARAYFAVGLEFEGPWLPKFASLSPLMKIVHTDGAVPKMAMPPDVEHEIDPSGPGKREHHDHGGLDPHIWLSPELVKMQAASIERALEEIDAAHAGIFRKNYMAFLHDIDSLENQLRLILPCDSPPSAVRTNQRTFLVFHPTWGYFARDFCLTQISIEIEGKEPSPRAMKEILDVARKFRIRTIFTQPEFSRKSAEVIARELHASVLDADALAYDWENNLLTVAREFANGAP